MRYRFAHYLLLLFVSMVLVNADTGRCIATDSIADRFQNDEEVETISVRISLGADGETADEPLALDLGLGFPLWLGEIGRADDDLGRFGAIGDQSDPGRTLTPGQTRTFRFDASTDSHSDPLSTTIALLSEVHISDISRIGILATGQSDWCLNEIHVTINEKPFYSATELDIHIQDEQALAQVRLRELREETTPTIEEAESLRELVRSGLATEGEEQRLLDIDQILTPQRQEQNRIERQIAGSYPWFLARDFQSPWRNGHSVESISVTVVTAPHAGAGSRNFAYYQTGGRKYLLTSPMNPLSGEYGPQVFPIDLIGGPATAGDLRGHAIGMLGHGEPNGEAPDRAHVQRVLVEVDGRIVFDSEENELDRLSLEATRLIPPAHRNVSGDLVQNTPIARETFRWNAGEGFGLDLVNGGALPLPSPTEESWPEPEPGLVYDGNSEPAALPHGFTEDFAPFPGEVYEEPSWSVTYEESFHAEGSGLPPDSAWPVDPSGDPWADPWGDPWADPGSGFGPGDSSSWGPEGHGDWEAPPSWLDILTGFLFDRFGFDLAVIVESVEEAVAEPIGEPVQIQNIAFEMPMPWDANWHVGWEICGDESTVDHYLIEVLLLRPEAPEVLAVVSETTSPVGEGIATFPIDATAVNDAVGSDPYSAYLLARVTPILAEDLSAGPGQFGVAYPLRQFADTLETKSAAFHYLTPGIPGIGHVGNQPPVLADIRAVWSPPTVQTHSGFIFASTPQTQHVVLRPEPTDLSIAYAFEERDGFESLIPRRIVCHLGFLGELTDLPSEARVQIEAWAQSTVSALHSVRGTTRILSSGTWDAPEPMQWVTIDLEPVVDPVTTLVEPSNLTVTVSVVGEIPDISRPPVVLGMRSFPMP